MKSYEFDKKHEATFYRSNDNWQRGREISLEKYNKSYRVEPLLMHEIPIGSEIKNTNQKFLYEYDFKKLWQFMVELIQVEKSESGKLVYPATVRVTGIGPSQYGTRGLFEKKIAKEEEKYDLEKAEMEEGFGREGESDTESDDEELDNGVNAEEDY